MTAKKHALFCRCGGERIEPGRMDDLGETLRTKGVKVTEMRDLCGLVGKRDPRLASLLREPGSLLVIGCYRRSMELLLAQALEPGEDLPSFEHINLIESNREQALRQLDDFLDGEEPADEYRRQDAGTAPGDEYRVLEEASDWISWFPVLDTARCTSCGQCADFCLFGVYEKSDRGVKVVHPEGCKNNCPACGRICPATAIVFPKYKYGGAIGGSEEIDEQAELQRQAQDVERILGEGDILEALEKRKAKRRSIIRSEAMRKAMEEREHALKNVSKN